MDNGYWVAGSGAEPGGPSLHPTAVSYYSPTGVLLQQEPREESGGRRSEWWGAVDEESRLQPSLATMGADHRITLTRRHAYRTVSNRVKTIKTPGGRYAAQYIKKSRKGARCGDCKCALPGVLNFVSIPYG